MIHGIGKLIFFITAIFCVYANAIELEKAKAFLQKKKPCRVAFTSVTRGQIPTFVYCIWDGIASEGTINQFDGCFLGRYALEEDRYAPIMNAGAGFQARSQPKGDCNKQAVLDILTRYPSSDWDQFGKNLRPILSEFRRNDKSMQIVYDEWNVVTPEILAAMDAWKPPRHTLKLKSLKDVKNCNTDKMKSEDEIYCLDAGDIENRCRNMSLSDEDIKLYRAIYKLKTGKPLVKCEMWDNSKPAQ